MSYQPGPNDTPPIDSRTSAAGDEPQSFADTAYVPPLTPTPEPPVPPKKSFYARRPVVMLTAVVVTVAVASGIAGGAVGARVSTGTASSTSTSLLTNDTSIGTAATTTGSVESAAKAIGPSVVTVAVSSQRGQGTGSGVIIKDDGYILTNNHVVEGVGQGGSVSVTLSNGSTASARIVGTDPSSDLAVIKAEGVSGIKAAVFANSEKLQVGQSVIAVGAPLGLSNTVTEGIVSTLHRPVTSGASGTGEQSVMDAIQTDAAINPGNSGGPLVDLAGRVVGINSAIATVGQSSDGQSGNIGVGFAIPSNDAVRVSDQLMSNGKATHAQLGVGLSQSQSAATSGAVLGQVNAGSPAAAAGLKPGDVITKINDRTIADGDSLIVAIRSYAPGDEVTITYERNGQPQTTAATLASAS